MIVKKKYISLVRHSVVLNWNDLQNVLRIYFSYLYIAHQFIVEQRMYVNLFERLFPLV